MCLKSIKHHEWLESRVISPVEQSRISYGLTLTCQKTELGVGMRRNSWYFYKGFFQFSASLFAPLEKWKDWFVVWKLQAEGESLGWLWLLSWVCLRICWKCCFNPASQLWRVTCSWPHLAQSWLFAEEFPCSVLTICRRKWLYDFIYFSFLEEAQKSLLSPYKGSNAMRYPLSVMKVKSNTSSPGVDWEALEGEAAAEMVPLHPAAMNLGTHNTPGSPGQKPPSPPPTWGPARGAADGKWLSGQAAFWQHVPPSRQLRAGGGGGACTRLGGRRLRSHVGAVWGGRASLELGAWQGSPAKLPLTSGDGEQHSFIATASSLTAVWLHPHQLDPRRKIQLCVPLDPALSDAAGAALFLPQSAQPNPHPQRAQGDGCRGEAWEALSRVYFCLQTMFNCLVLWPIWKDIGFFSRVHPHAHFLPLARLWSSTSEARWYLLLLLLLLLLILLLVPRETPRLSVPWDKGLWVHVTPGRCNGPLGKAWGKTYRYREPSSKRSLLWATPPSPNIMLSFGLVCLPKEMVSEASSWNENGRKVYKVVTSVKISNTESARVGCAPWCAGGGSALLTGTMHLVCPA